MQTIAITQTMHQTTYRHLGSRILYSDTAHDTTSNRRLNSIRHTRSLQQRGAEITDDQVHVFGHLIAVICACRPIARPRKG